MIDLSNTALYGEHDSVYHSDLPEVDADQRPADPGLWMHMIFGARFWTLIRRNPASSLARNLVDARRARAKRPAAFRPQKAQRRAARGTHKKDTRQRQNQLARAI